MAPGQSTSLVPNFNIHINVVVPARLVTLGTQNKPYLVAKPPAQLGVLRALGSLLFQATIQSWSDRRWMP